MRQTVSPEELADFARDDDTFVGARMDENGEPVITVSAFAEHSAAAAPFLWADHVRALFIQRPILGSAIWGACSIGGFVLHPLLGLAMMGVMGAIVVRWQEHWGR